MQTLLQIERAKMNNARREFALMKEVISLANKNLASFAKIVKGAAQSIAMLKSIKSQAFSRMNRARAALLNAIKTVHEMLLAK